MSLPRESKLAEPYSGELVELVDELAELVDELAESSRRLLH